MSDNVVVWWLVLSFAVMTVAMLGFLFEKLEGLERRLDHLEGPRRDDDGCIPADAKTEAERVKIASRYGGRTT